MRDESKERQQDYVLLRERLLGDEEVRSIISLRAYEIYQQRGGEPGRELDDWLQAEDEILTVMMEEERRRSVEKNIILLSPAAPLPAPTAKTAKSQTEPHAAKRSKLRTASKSSAWRRQKTKVEQSATAEEGAAKKTARLIKRSKPASKQNGQD